jgi:hypothetical protein
VDAQLCEGNRQCTSHPEGANAPCETVRLGRRYSVKKQNALQPYPHVSDDEPNAKRVVGNEPHVPCVGQQTSRGTDAHRNVVSTLVTARPKMKTALRCDTMNASRTPRGRLQRPIEIAARCGGPPEQDHSAYHLEQH